MILCNRLLFFRDNVVVLSSMLEISKKDIWPFPSFKMKSTHFFEMSEIDYPENGNHVSFLYGKLYVIVRCLNSILKYFTLNLGRRNAYPEEGLVLLTSSNYIPFPLYCALNRFVVISLLLLLYDSTG
jgi:hypothetical protein